MAAPLGPVKPPTTEPVIGKLALRSPPTAGTLKVDPFTVPTNNGKVTFQVFEAFTTCMPPVILPNPKLTVALKLVMVAGPRLPDAVLLTRLE